MRSLRFKVLVMLPMILLFGCAPAQTQKAQTVITEASATEVPPITFDVNEIPDARSHSLATGPDGALYVMYGQQQSLFVARSTDGGATFRRLMTDDVPGYSSG